MSVKTSAKRARERVGCPWDCLWESWVEGRGQGVQPVLQATKPGLWARHIAPGFLGPTLCFSSVYFVGYEIHMVLISSL